MSRIYISVGSNIDAEHHLRVAVEELGKRYGELTLSSVYESEAVGFAGDNFLNMVIGLKSDDDVASVITTLHEIEDSHGRVRSGPRFSARTLDLDLLLYDDLQLQQQGVDIPREEITKNAFVLWPLAEIAPQLVHPTRQQTMQVLWDNYDKATQKLWPITLQF